VLQHHYRSPMEFGGEQLETMKRGWLRLNRTYQQLAGAAPAAGVDEARKAGAPEELLHAVQRTRERFFAAMADDFNTAAALASLFELLREVRPLLGQSPDDGAKAALGAARAVLEELGAGILGVLTLDPLDPAGDTGGRSDELVRELVNLIVEIRSEARAARDFARADRIRDALQRLGIVLEDRPDGTRWSFKE